MLPDGNRLSGSSSFADYLSATAPDLMPGAAARGNPGSHGDLAPHGTTIVAATFDGGVVMAGDRRATMGNVIAQRDIQKVFPADEFSCIGIAGSAGLAIELVRLFQVELEHYEKIEGIVLSADGKANRLAALIRGNLGLAMSSIGMVLWDRDLRSDSLRTSSNYGRFSLHFLPQNLYGWVLRLPTWQNGLFHPDPHGQVVIRP